MNAVFEKEYELRTNDFDYNNRLHPSAILDLFQTAAGDHAVMLGTGYEEMIKKKLIWVMTKVKIKIFGQPERFTSVKVRSWPLPNGRVIFQREYLMIGSNGRVIAAGSSEWVTIHMEKRKITAPGNIYNLPEEDLISDKNFEGKLSRIPSFEAEDGGSAIVPAYTDIDINGHVNNTKYAGFILNAYPLSENESIDEMQIDYHLEIKQGSEIVLYSKNVGDAVLFSGKNKDNQLNFSARITKKK